MDSEKPKSPVNLGEGMVMMEGGSAISHNMGESIIDLDQSTNTIDNCGSNASTLGASGSNASPLVTTDNRFIIASGNTAISKPTAVKVPTFNGDNPEHYKSWKGFIELWKDICTVPKHQMAHRVILEGITPGSRASKELLLLPNEVYKTDNGIDVIFEKLDDIFLPFREYQTFIALREYHDIKRKSGVSISDHVTEWSQKLTELNKQAYTLDSVRALELLHSCELPFQERQTILNSVQKPLSITGMKDALRISYPHFKMTENSKSLDSSIFNENGHSSGQDSGTLFTQYRGAPRGRGRSNRGRSRGQIRYNHPYSRSNQTVKQAQFNRKGADGEYLRCYNCKSKEHLKQQCPELGPNTDRRCFICQAKDHFVAQCPQNAYKYKGALLTGKDSGEAVVQVTSHMSSAVESDYDFQEDEFILGGNTADDNQVIQYITNIETEETPIDRYDDGENFVLDALGKELNMKKELLQVDLFVGCASTQNGNTLQTLVTESKGYAVLDSGCSMNVCGAPWATDYFDGLDSEYQKLVTKEPSTHKFSFGGGHTVTSLMRITLPCWIAGKKGKIITDVVPCNIPLLLSRFTMEQCGFILDFGRRMVIWEGREIKLKLTSTGHYCLGLHL